MWCIIAGSLTLFQFTMCFFTLFPIKNFDENSTQTCNLWLYTLPHVMEAVGSARVNFVSN